MQTELTEAEGKALLTRLLGGKLPDEHGRFGPFGGRYAPETLIPALERLEAGVGQYLHAPEFVAELNRELEQWAGRPTPLTHARRLSERWGAEIYLKREDMAHTGAHKINNALGQALLAEKLGAKRIIAETGAGQHGVATAAACARVGIPCIVYMGTVDVERQAPNVDRMHQLGAEVVSVDSGDRTLRAAIDEAFRDWVGDPEDSYYLLGSAVGPHPYPYLVRELQSVIGKEARRQFIELVGRLPDAAVACVGGGSNAIGLFHPLLGDENVQLIGIEAGGRGTGLGDNSATLEGGTPGVLHGCYSILLQDADGQVQETHSVSAGLDYPGVGPEHALLKAVGRVRYMSATDEEALEAVYECCEAEGILPALESAHALVGARRWARKNPETRILIGLSGRGDKDMPTLSTTSRGSNNCRNIGNVRPMQPHEKITAALRAATQAGRVGLVPYITAGFPEKDGFIDTLRKVAAVADVVEIGVPFSDPMADGVTIQRASHAAIANGVSLRWILQVLTSAGDVGAPIVLMSYLNPLLAFGYDELAAACIPAGVCGFIVPDMPLEER